MLMEVKKEIKIIFLAVKYNLMKQMLNKVTFITNILFMILNNATFIVQWIVLFSIRDEIGGYGLKEVLLLWGFAAGSFGIAHIFFDGAFDMAKLIINGKLDTFLVQPKNALIGVITSKSSVSAIGDLIYAYIILFIYGFSILRFMLFTFLIIIGGIVLTEVSVVTGSLCFWLTRGDLLVDNVNHIMVTTATYPDTIFKNAVRLLLYTIIPVGMTAYLPCNIMLEFNVLHIIYTIFMTIIFGLISFGLFNKGLKRYSSSNLMSSRI